MSTKKTVIITGAGSGIGAATAKRYVRDGWNVVLNGRTREKLEEIKTEIGQDDQVLIAQGDVSKSEDVKQIIKQTVDRFGSVDALINNAGIGKMSDFQNATQEQWDEVITINAGGCFKMAKEAYPHLKERKGAIVNTSSVSGIGGDWGAFVYNTSKGAVTNMTRAMALDLAKDGIRVNAVAPSLTWTEMTDGMDEDKELMDQFETRIPMGRAAKPEEIADVIAFLTHDDARFVTGVILPVDGGLSASNGQPPLG